jgi:YVTN family beta-propeller protein
VIDTRTETVAAVVPVGLTPVAVAVAPDGARVYVTDQGSDSVSVIDTGSDAVTGVIRVGSAPFGVAVAPGCRHPEPCP